jgi:predicted nucleic acid-binding protein
VIVVDTSVWIAARRQPGADVAEVLSGLLDADEVALALPVKLELWAGVAKVDRQRFQRAFSALPLLVPTEDTWQPLDDWIARAADNGLRIGLTDLLIARLADEAGALVWSLDADIERLAALELVRLYR